MEENDTMERIEKKESEIWPREEEEQKKRRRREMKWSEIFQIRSLPYELMSMSMTDDDDDDDEFFLIFLISKSSNFVHEKFWDLQFLSAATENEKNVKFGDFQSSDEVELLMQWLTMG